jgi:hypothetical protein
MSKITVAMAGVTIIVPAAVAAGVAASGGSSGAGGHGSSLLAMAGSHAAAASGPATLDVGTPMTGAARHEVAALGVRQAIAERAAEKAADRRAARRAAQRAAERRAGRQAAAKSTTSHSSGGSGGSSAQPSGSPQHIAMAMLGSYGWSSSQFGCLQSLWNAESGWNVYASNPSSGAYGIPQALPGSKMANAGPDWQSNAATQIRWGLGYIKGLYGSPCGAWSHEEADGWY